MAVIAYGGLEQWNQGCLFPRENFAVLDRRKEPRTARDTQKLPETRRVYDERMIRWIPLVVPLLAVLLATAWYLIDYSVLR